MSQLEIPKGYRIKKISDFCHIDNGYAFKSIDYKKSGIPLIRISNIQDNKIQIKQKTVFINSENLETKSKFLVKENDILIALTGATTGKCGIYDQNTPSMLNQRVGRLRLHTFDKNLQKYIFYFLKKMQYDILSKSYGGAQPNISTKFIENYDILFPNNNLLPTLVKKIDHIFEIISKKQQEILQKFNTENNLIDLEKYLKSSFFDYSSLNTCPHVLLEKLLLDARYGTSKKSVWENIGIPIIRIPNIKTGKIDFSELKYSKLEKSEIEKLTLISGDIVVCRTNGSLNLVGKSALIQKTERNFAFASYLIRLRPDPKKIDSEYLNYFLDSNIGKNHIQKLAKTSAGQYNISLPILRSLSIPLPKLKEQQKIVKEIQINKIKIVRINNKIIQTKTMKKNTLKIMQNLIQSSLNQAFSGRLVN